eukprot:5230854-Pleurochrysis_carterae.AAC.1
MFVKRASSTAVRNATMAPKKNKDLWFSFVVGLDFQGIQQEARAALRTALEACGFKVTKTPVMCYVKGTRIHNNMVHVEFSDYPSDVADHAWHEWAVGARGLSVLCNGITLNVNLHNMDSTFMRDALKVKPICFHKHDKVCICKQSSNVGRGGNRCRPTTEERRAEKQSQQNAELEMLKQLAELNSTSANAGKQYPFTHSIRRLRVFCKKRDFARPFIYLNWDGTLGFPGEGPNFMFVSANLRGGVLSKARWTSTLKSLLELHADFISVQEHNLHRDSKGLDSIKFLANKHGFVFFFSPLPHGKRIGGAGILVRNDIYARLQKTRFRSHYSGGACTLSFTLNDIELKVASVYAPAEGKERSAFFKSISSMIDSSTILSGDFNCVDDTTLDTQRSSNTPYSNEGADVLQTIVIKHSLRDEIREQLGIGFEFTHSQKTPNGGYCLSRIDRQYLPDLPN